MATAKPPATLHPRPQLDHCRTTITASIIAKATAGMCFQGFARFRCGHTSMFEAECEAARDLELPFFQKIQCPDYSISSLQPDAMCGKAKFYCAETDDGKYLDHVAACRQDLDSRLEVLEATRKERLLPQKQLLLDRIFQAAGANEQKAKLLFASDPDAKKFMAALQALKSQMEMLQARRKEANDILLYSKQFFLLQTTARQLPARQPAPLPSNLRHFPTQTDSHTPIRATQQRPASHLFHATSYLSPSYLVSPSAPQNVGSHGLGTKVNRRRLESLSSGLRLSMSSTMLKRDPTDEADTGSGFLSLSKKSVHSMKKTKEESFVEPPVRRSARVRDKKVNYADDASDTRSRSPSPDKSDASSFSPSKSEAPAAPFDPAAGNGGAIHNLRPLRTRSSLRDIIKEDSRKRDSINAADSSTPEPQTQEQQDVPAPQNQETEMHRENASTSNTAPNEMMQTWLVNRGDFDMSINPTGGSHTAMGTGLFNSASDTTPKYAYEQMQKRVNSPATLTPPTLQGMLSRTPSNVKDPKKRLSSSVGLDQPVQKHLRLSLPDDTETRDIYRNSPLRRSATQLKGDATRPVTPPTDRPAPILVPTAFMAQGAKEEQEFVPSPGSEVSSELSELESDIDFSELLNGATVD